jgi:hypothetical protein
LEAAAIRLGVVGTTTGTLGFASNNATGGIVTVQNLGAGSQANYNFNLPLAVGAAGSVLTSQGGSSPMTWTAQGSLAVAWSSLQNATTNLAISNAGFTTTFTQTSNVIWTWDNTTAATSSTTNGSPQFQFQANYWTGSASALDYWQIGTALAAGTNGVSTFNVNHPLGSTGSAILSTNGNIQFSSNNSSLDFGANTSWTWYWTDSSITNTDAIISYAAGSSLTIQAGASSNTGPSLIMQGYKTTGTGASVKINNAVTFTGTSGSQILASIGATFNPASGSATFQCLNMAPVIEGTSSGNTYALRINPTLTATNLTGTNYLATFESSSTVEHSFDYSGNAQFNGAVVAGSTSVSAPSAGFYYSGNTKGVSAGSFTAITAITTTGGIVTQLTGTSDGRLKDWTTYDGGLDKILSLTPALYRWNAAGQKHTGLNGDQEYVGFIAQDVQSAIPQAITATEGDEKYLSLDDRPIIAALVNAIKELKAEIDALKARK